MEKIFDGAVDIYLWGNDAITDGENNRFLIGSNPDLVLVDNRGIIWKDVNDFNVPSHAEIFADIDEDGIISLKIVLTKIAETVPEKTLLLGVSEDSTIPNYDVEWEVYREHKPKGVTVVILINSTQENTNDE